MLKKEHKKCEVILRKSLKAPFSVFLATMLLFQCSEAPGIQESMQISPYKQKSSPGEVDDRSQDELPIAGQKLGERTASRVTAPVPVTGGGNPVVAPPPAQLPPPPPKPTHVFQVSCSGSIMTFMFTFEGKNEGLRTSEPMACPRLSAALNGKSFPTGKTVSNPRGGATLNTSCDDGTMNFILKEANGVTETSLSLQLGLKSSEVCTEVSNIINGLKV